jgi:hypothetical protein
VDLTLATKKRKTWTCPKCKRKNEARTSSRQCAFGCGATKPKPRVPEHAKVLQDVRYPEAAKLSVLIHGGDKDACGCCGRPKPESGNHDRDHGHRKGEHSYGKIRGLACFRCNNLVLQGLTLEDHRNAVAYLERSEAHYARSR